MAYVLGGCSRAGSGQPPSAALIIRADMGVRGDDQVSANGHCVTGHHFRIRQYVHWQPRGFGGKREAIIGRGGDHADKLDPFFKAQLLEHGGAEVAGSHQDAFHRQLAVGETAIVRECSVTPAQTLPVGFDP